jgi:hypothetical protein
LPRASLETLAAFVDPQKLAEIEFADWGVWRAFQILDGMR